MTFTSKIYASVLTLLFSVITFAQERVRPDRFDEPEEDLLGFNVPVDQYTMVLIGAAVAMIAFYAYRRMQIKNA